MGEQPKNIITDPKLLAGQRQYLQTQRDQALQTIESLEKKMELERIKFQQIIGHIQCLEFIERGGLAPKTKEKMEEGDTDLDKKEDKNSKKVA